MDITKLGVHICQICGNEFIPSITLKGDIHTILARLCILVGMFLEVIHTCSFIFQFLVCTFILGEHTAFDFFYFWYVRGCEECIPISAFFLFCM